MITASTGDNGYEVQFPAASQYVTAVGGTTLHVNANDSWGSETVWNGTGSGCSVYVAKPSWQNDVGCSGRTVADVSADADPNTGAAVYDSVTYLGQSGWFQVGGTSLSAPLIASVYALTGTASTANYGSAPYAQPVAAARRHVGQQRQLQPRLPVHRRHRLRRPDRSRDAERARRVHDRRPASASAPAHAGLHGRRIADDCNRDPGDERVLHGLGRRDRRLLRHRRSQPERPSERRVRAGVGDRLRVVDADRGHVGDHAGYLPVHDHGARAGRRRTRSRRASSSSRSRQARRRTSRSRCRRRRAR